MAYVVVVKKYRHRRKYDAYDVMLYDGEDPTAGWAFGNRKEAITKGKEVAKTWRCRLLVRC